MSNAFYDFFKQTIPFSDLSLDLCDALSQQVQPLRYRMGQPIIKRGDWHKDVYILYKGQGRCLGYEPPQQKPFTLGLLKPGAVIGWVNAARGVACETAIASTEDTLCLKLNTELFAELLTQSPMLREQFQEHCSMTEALDVLGLYFSKKAKTNGNLKEIIQAVHNKASLINLQPGKYRLDDPAIAPLRDHHHTWFVSGGEIQPECPSGNPLNLNQLDVLEVQGIQPARLIGFPTALLTPLKPPSTEAVSHGDSHNGSDRPMSLGPALEPDPFDDSTEAPEAEIPYAPVEVVGLSPEPASTNQQTQDFPFVMGKTETEAAIACFQMLAQYYKMRFKGDVIRRVVDAQFSRYERLSLPNSGAIAELMGLTAQLVKVPTHALARLSCPVLVRWRGHLSIVFDIQEKQVTVAVPTLGLLKRSPEEFIADWESKAGVAEIVLLKKGKYSPEERFSLRWFIPAIKKHKWILIEVLIASFLVQLFALANPLVIQQIIDKVIVQQSAGTLQVYGALLLILAVFEALLSSLRTYLFVDTTNRIDMGLGSEIIDHLFRLPLQYFEKRPVGEISTRVGELEKIRQFLTGTALTVILDAIFSVVYILVMFYYHGKLAAVSLSVIPIFIVVTLIFSPIIRRQLRDKAEKNAESQSYLVEVMTGVQTVKAQNIELRSRWKWQEKYARYVSSGFNTVITSTASNSISNFLNKLSGLLVLWYGTSLVLQGPEVLTLGQLIAFRIIAGYVTSPILRLTQLWQNFQETSISLERLADILDHPQEGEADRENIPMPLIEGAVTYENVSFRFKPHGALNVDNVSLDFPVGTFAAVVGQSGAGKSTLIKLLSRLYEPESGRILVDGYDINKVELYSLREQVGVVPQESLLFEGTIQENIALTDPDAEPAAIEAAAKVAAAHGFIMQSLPNGYNTQVGERGAALSGGQKQRIAIARSVLQRPRVLVLDEATSALDYLTEREVCRNLKKTFHDTTVFFITHRLDTIKDADVIILMHEGSVAEQGTHSELMALKGRYYSLYQQQSKSQ